MLHVEKVEINGKEFVRTWSDEFQIERDGVLYSEAIDPVDTNREYKETDIPLEKLELEPQPQVE